MEGLDCETAEEKWKMESCCGSDGNEGMKQKRRTRAIKVIRIGNEETDKRWRVRRTRITRR